MLRTAVLLALALALGTTACAPKGPAGPDTAARIDAVQSLRAELAAPAEALGTLVGATSQAVLDARLGGGAVAGRRSRLDAIASTVLADLRVAASAGASVDVTGDTVDEIAVAAAWADVTVRASALVSAAEADVARMRDLDDVEVGLLEVVTAWDEPGSRSEQLGRLEVGAERAEALVAAAERLAPDPACSRDVARRIAAARHVAAATRELVRLIGARRGTEFDARRAELGADPLGQGGPLLDLDAEDGACVVDGLPTAVAAAAALEALSALEAALSPPDLTGEG